MANILYLVHRLPYPPNKGDKLRSFHFLKHLSKNHRVFLGTFIDTPDDECYVAELRNFCASIKAVRLNPASAKVRSINSLLSGQPLTIHYFRDTRMQRWVDSVVETQQIDTAIVFCSGMAQYLKNRVRLPVLLDMVDVDSAKWGSYAQQQDWPMNWIYAREAALLRAYERQIAGRSSRTFFVTAEERQVFAAVAPECALRLETISNGVDCGYFSQDIELHNPFPSNPIPIVFTGTMDYWINVEGIIWFVHEVMPQLVIRWPKLKLYIVGRNPCKEINALASEHVVVTGAVPDTRPYLKYAAAVVAPIRTSRGIQNKIIEAMAMAKAVVAHAECALPINAVLGEELLSASTAEEFLAMINNCISDPALADAIGVRARQRVLRDYDWETNLSKIDRYLSEPSREKQ